jgi:hypothetical protein
MLQPRQDQSECVPYFLNRLAADVAKRDPLELLLYALGRIDSGT